MTTSSYQQSAPAPIGDERENSESSELLPVAAPGQSRSWRDDDDDHRPSADGEGRPWPWRPWSRRFSRTTAPAAKITAVVVLSGVAIVVLVQKWSSSSSKYFSSSSAVDHVIEGINSRKEGFVLRTISPVEGKESIRDVPLEGKKKKKKKKHKDEDEEGEPKIIPDHPPPENRQGNNQYKQHSEHHGVPHQASERCDWVVDLFTEKYAGTPETELGAQYHIQSADPNYFYRATANIFWIDFVLNGWGDRLQFEKLGVNTVHPDGEPFQPKSTWTWVTGDQHLSNFGAWKNRHSEVVFGVNDFDEAAIYDFQVDVLRIAVSLVGHAYYNGLTEGEIDVVLRAFTDTYVQTVVNYVGGDRELLFEITPETSRGTLKQWLESVRDNKSPEKQLTKFTEKDPHTGDRRFTRNDSTRLVEVTPEEDAEIRSQFTSRKYGASMMKTGWHVRGWDDEYFDILDIARRVGSGVGSYGVDRYYILLRGKDEDADDWKEDEDSVILDVKYEPPGAVTRILTPDDAAWYDQLFDHDAQRAVEGQRRLTSYTDPFTGWVVLDNRPFVVRQRSPWKAGPDDVLASMTDPNEYIEFMEQIAVATATSHARGTAAKSPGQFKHVIAAALGRWSDRTQWGTALGEVAKDYRDQVLLDFRCFRAFVDERYGDGGKEVDKK